MSYRVGVDPMSYRVGGNLLGFVQSWRGPIRDVLQGGGHPLDGLHGGREPILCSVLYQPSYVYIQRYSYHIILLLMVLRMFYYKFTKHDSLKRTYLRILQLLKLQSQQVGFV